MTLSNKLFISLFISFILGKLTSLNTKFNHTTLEKDSLSFILEPITNLFSNLNLSSIHSLDLINLGHGYEGSSHILNYLITYTPIIFVFLCMFSFNKKEKATITLNFKGDRKTTVVKFERDNLVNISYKKISFGEYKNSYWADLPTEYLLKLKNTFFLREKTKKLIYSTLYFKCCR